MAKMMNEFSFHSGILGMDEGLLNDLLECSVCLERLDTSSRVLPCQHTFCLKCLKVIVESHKELRCPECRVLVEAKVEELPPNVLLMRILEGMRNSSPRNPSASTQKTLRAGLGHQAHQGGPQPAAGSDGKLPPPHARALHDYRSKEIGDLSFKKGETIFLHKRLDPLWYQGECGGRSGIFPIAYVQVVAGLPAPAALCKALYDFRMSAPDEEGCLAFDKGTIIAVHRRVDENWAEGRAGERVGIFPLAFVELNAAAAQLVNSPTLNRPVPPPEPRAGHADHRHRAQIAQRLQQMSMSTPTSTPQNYQNVANMSQSQPSYNQQTTQQPMQMLQQMQMGQQVGVLTAVPRNIIDTKHSELIHYTNLHNKSGHHTVGPTVGLQSVSRINDNFERLRNAKFDYSTTPIQKTESTYQNVRSHEHFPVSVANFNTQSSDSSSSNTNSVGASTTTTPNTSDTSTSEEPSLPSSPDNPEVAPVPEQNPELNTSLGVLSLNESSTATNTALNVSLPPADSPHATKPEKSAQERKSDPGMIDVPSSSKTQPRATSANYLPAAGVLMGSSGVAPGSPSVGPGSPGVRPGSTGVSEVARRDKRHSLTSSTQLGSQQASQNRVPAEGREARAGRGARRRSAERPLPALHVALYAYRPQKPDELELKKGCTYLVTERCRDGWFKGRSERSQRAGVFPGNYVALARAPDTDQQLLVPMSSKPAPPSAAPAPCAPPRGPDPAVAYIWGAGGVQQVSAKPEKAKEKSRPSSSIASGVGLMKRLAAMKRSPAEREPEPAYCDNPVFDDGPPAASPAPPAPAAHPAHPAHPAHAHVRSGSCPSQLLGSLPAGAGGGGGGSQRLRGKERPALAHDYPPRAAEGAAQHRKSASLDVGAARRDARHAHALRERFRCIVPYPPNSEYELELKVDDIVLVHRKRGDGWYKGTLQRTGRTGLFPASFVQSCPE